MTPRVHLIFSAVLTVVVALTVAWGFVLVGSPATRRLERLDRQRLRDLRTISDEIQRMVEDANEPGTLKAALPQTLDEAADRARDQRLNPRDPQTGEPYGYTVTGDTTYELCADFARERDADSGVFWNHPPGRHCFTIDVLDPPDGDGPRRLYRGVSP